MPTRTATAVWEGDLKTGNGKLSVESQAFETGYSFMTRFENATGTNPEELIGAAHAGCFSMALSAGLTRAGHPPQRIQTEARVKLEKVGEGFAITGIELATDAVVPGIDDAAFQKHAEEAKKNCPVSKALAGVKIDLTAKLTG